MSKENLVWVREDGSIELHGGWEQTGTLDRWLDVAEAVGIEGDETRAVVWNLGYSRVTVRIASFVDDLIIEARHGVEIRRTSSSVPSARVIRRPAVFSSAFTE